MRDCNEVIDSQMYIVKHISSVETTHKHVCYLNNSYHHIFPKHEIDELRISPQILSTVNEKQRLQELEARYSVVTGIYSLSTLISEETDSNPSFTQHIHVVTTITDRQNVGLLEPFVHLGDAQRFGAGSGLADDDRTQLLSNREELARQLVVRVHHLQVHASQRQA